MIELRHLTSGGGLYRFNFNTEMIISVFKIGDNVMWKSGTELYGKIVNIQGSYAIVSTWNSETGEREDIRVPLAKLFAD